MGLGSALETAMARVAIGRIAKKVPMLNNVVTWLTEVPGRKRSIAAVAGVTSVVLHHAGEALAELCTNGYEVACGWRLDVFSDFALKAGQWVEGLSAGADVVAVVMGVWGLGH